MQSLGRLGSLVASKVLSAFDLKMDLLIFIFALKAYEYFKMIFRETFSD